MVLLHLLPDIENGKVDVLHLNAEHVDDDGDLFLDLLALVVIPLSVDEVDIENTRNHLALRVEEEEVVTQKN